jgi:hypothetical protein
MTIWSMVSTLGAKCGTRVMILPHSSTFPTKKSLSSPSRSARPDDLPSLSLSSESSDFLDSDEPFLARLGGEDGLGSMRAVIWPSFWTVCLRRLRMRARTILNVSSRKAVVL